MKNITTLLPFETLRSHLLPSAELPFALELEQAVLGVIMAEDGCAIEQSMLMLSGDSFYDGRHRTIFGAMMAIERAGGKTDLYTVGEQLRNDNNLGAVGGMVYLTELLQKIGSGSHFGNHVRHLLQCQIGRSIAASSYRTMCRVLDGTDVSDVMDSAQADLDNIATIGMVDTNCCHISDITTEVISQAYIRAEKAKQGLVNGVPTGLTELDKLTGGWKAGQLIILAARPAMGKTALMLHFAISAAKANVPVMIFSLEMSRLALVERMTLCQCDVSADNFRSGKLSTSEFAEISIAKTKLDVMPIAIDDKGNVSMRYIATHAKIAHRKGKCDMVLIDYLQILDMRTAERGRNREQEVAQCTKAAKELAKELGIPVILLAQLSRTVEGRGGNKEPMLSDLRESGAIEQDADIVLFPHRPEYYFSTQAYADMPLPNGSTAVGIPLKGFGKLIVAKQRDGATGIVMFNYNAGMSRFWDFDLRPYLSSGSRSTDGSASGSRSTGGGSGVGNRPVSPGSMHYIDPAADDDNVPF